MNSVLYLFGLVLATVALAMLPAALFAQVSGETDLTPVFLLSAAVTGFVGGGLIFGLRGSESRLKQIEAIALATLLWLVTPVFIALPFYTAGAHDALIGSLFEAFSAFTTTGSSLLANMEQQPRAIVFWRAFVEWLGGFASLMTVLLLLAPNNIGGMSDRPLRSVEVGSKSARARILGTGARILPVYAGTTALCIVLLSAAGIPAFDALCLGFSTLSTGGFMPGARSIEAYDSRLAELVLGVFMLLGGTSIVWQRHIVTRRWQNVLEYNEIRGLMMLVGAVAAVFAASLNWGGGGIAGLHIVDAAWTGLMASISVITTTGFEVREGAYAVLSMPVLIALAIVGGAGYSTAGGLKLFRFGAMMGQAQREMRRLVYPHGINSTRYGGQNYDIQIMKAIWVAFMSFIGAIAVATLALTYAGLGFEASLMAAISSISNVGGIYGGLEEGIDSWVPYADMSAPVLSVLIVTMALGRMEILAFFVFFNIYYWRS